MRALPLFSLYAAAPLGGKGFTSTSGRGYGARTLRARTRPPPSIRAGVPYRGSGLFRAQRRVRPCAPFPLSAPIPTGEWLRGFYSRPYWTDSRSVGVPGTLTLRISVNTVNPPLSGRGEGDRSPIPRRGTRRKGPKLPRSHPDKGRFYEASSVGRGARELSREIRVSAWRSNALPSPSARPELVS